MDLIKTSTGSKLKAFYKNNIYTICIFVFIFTTGCAAGIHIIQNLCKEDVAKIITIAPLYLFAENHFWLIRIASALASHLLVFLMLYISGLWVALSPLWVASILLRGLVFGAAVGSCVTKWPACSAKVLLFLLLVEAALLLPPLLKLSVLSQKQLFSICKSKLQATLLAPSAYEYSNNFFKTGLLLIPCILYQSVMIPALLHALCTEVAY